MASKGRSPGPEEYATPVEGETTYTVDEAAAILGTSPQRVREMLVTGELEGIPPGATLSGDWKVLLSASLEEGEELGQEAPADERDESLPEDQGEDAPVDEEAERFVAPPQSAAEAEADAQAEPSASEETSRGDDAAADREPAAPSGWVSTQQAAKALGITPRTVRWHIEQGNLEAKPEGEGVRRSWSVSIDSLQAFRDKRQATGDAPRALRAADEATDIAPERPGEAVRVLAERLEDAAARAAEYRVRLELTVQAESTLRAELAEERRLREAAVQERDDLCRRLEASREPPREARGSPASPAPTQPPTESSGDAQEAREATQSAAETLRGPAEPRPPTGSAQQSLQRPAQPGLRGRIWRRVFGG
jgi:DNA-binding transcriptional MerR regulator